MRHGQNTLSRVFPVIALSILVFLVAAKSGEPARVGVVDLNQIFKGCKKMKNLEQSYAQAAAAENENLKAQQERVTSAKEDLALLEKGTTRYEELERKLFGYMQEALFERNKANERLARLKVQYHDELMREIKDSIREYGKKNGYTVILQREFTLPKEMNTWQAVLYQDDAADLTEAILAVLDSA